jgi:hypothetical protein
MPTSILNHKSIIAACHFTGIFDVNRNTILPNDDYSYLKAWADSITALGLTGTIFHNHFTEQTCTKYQNENIHFIKKEYNPIYNPNIYRYFIYQDFLQANAQYIEHIFFTDIGDVEVVTNPFIQHLFKNNPNSIFCGDEPKLLNNEWMQQHSTHLRNKIHDYTAYEEKFKNTPLLNCGIIGGSITIMQQFINDISCIHQQYNSNNDTLYTGDMGAFNYLVRTKYNNNVLHGSPINTIFKAYEKDRKDCWFRHK